MSRSGPHRVDAGGRGYVAKAMKSQRIAERYTLQREIGRGAGGVVWAAHDEVLGRTVALKRLGASGMGSEALRAEREARLAARVGHAHVVAVFDLVTEDDGTWLVMEHVDGTSLADVARDTPMTADETARLIAPVADALAQAHALGIVHRDVKPSNMLAGPDGVKLSDFGIARAADDATLTRTGVVTGSPAYLAPEVAVGGQATEASDVWSLGATLLHLLEGRPPYHVDGLDNGPLAVVYRIVHEDVPVSPTAAWLAPVLGRMMQKAPTERPSMAQVRDVLSRTANLSEQTAVLPALPTVPPPTHPPTVAPGSSAVAARDHRRLPVIAGAVAGAVLAVLLVVMITWSDGKGDVPAATTSSPTASSQSPQEGATAAPSAAALEEFARNYVATASSTPDRGFEMLTAAYRAKSPNYSGFWGTVKNPKILDVTADPAAMTVTYRYSYVLKGRGRRTESVTLFLVDQGGNLMIDNASAVAR